MTAGYSGTPLAKKLGFKDGQRTWFDGMPDSLRAEVDSYGVRPSLSSTAQSRRSRRRICS